MFGKTADSGTGRPWKGRPACFTIGAATQPMGKMMNERDEARLRIAVELARFEMTLLQSIVVAVAADARPEFRRLAISRIERSFADFRPIIELPPDAAETFEHDTTALASMYISLLSDPA